MKTFSQEQDLLRLSHELSSRRQYLANLRAIDLQIYLTSRTAQAA